MQGIVVRRRMKKELSYSLLCYSTRSLHKLSGFCIVMQEIMFWQHKNLGCVVSFNNKKKKKKSSFVLQGIQFVL
jgi:hypothetical protein